METSITLARKALKNAAAADTGCIARIGLLFQWNGDLEQAHAMLDRCMENLQGTAQPADALMEAAHLAAMLRRPADRESLEDALPEDWQRTTARCIYLGDLAFQEDYGRDRLEAEMKALEERIEEIPGGRERDIATGSLVLSAAILGTLNPRFPGGKTPVRDPAPAAQILQARPRPNGRKRTKAELILERAERISLTEPERRQRNPSWEEWRRDRSAPAGRRD